MSPMDFLSEGEALTDRAQSLISSFPACEMLSTKSDHAEAEGIADGRGRRLAELAAALPS